MGCSCILDVEQTKERPNYPNHIRSCFSRSYGPRFHDVRIIARSKDSKAREFMEAFFMNKKGDLCVSNIIVVLYISEKQYSACVATTDVNMFSAQILTDYI